MGGMVERAGNARVCQLMLPPADEALVASPTWTVGSGRRGDLGQPVSLVMALEQQPAARHAQMIDDHREVLVGVTVLAEAVLADSAWDAPQRRGVGYNVVLFAAELASALRSPLLTRDVDADARRECTEAVMAATLAAAGCLAATILEHQAGQG